MFEMKSSQRQVNALAKNSHSISDLMKEHAHTYTKNNNNNPIEGEKIQSIARRQHQKSSLTMSRISKTLENVEIVSKIFLFTGHN